MDITGADLADKFRELFPDHSFKISPELLKETCDDPAVQPFLKWFCEHVGPENVLEKEEIERAKILKESGAWLTGKELDDALAEATKDCPELLQLVQPIPPTEAELKKAYKAEKEAHDADANDLAILEDSLKRLIQVESELDDELEEAKTKLERAKIQQGKSYADCVSLMEEFDFAHREIYADLQNLVKVYADAAEKKGPVIVWTQVPLEIFIKQSENYYNCLQLHVNRELKNENIEDLSNTGGKDESQDFDQCENEKACKLSACETNLIKSTLAEIFSKVELGGVEALCERAREIYNDGFPKIPQNETQLKTEIAEMTTKRDLLEEDIALLETQLHEAVSNYGRYTVMKILVDDGHARLENKKARLSKIENLLYLARDEGHAYADLLAMLMQAQLRKLNEIIEFVTDARHYLATEYTLSAKRCDIMKEEQEKYEAIISGPPCKQNIYNELFAKFMLGSADHPDALNLAVKRYDEILAENKKLKEELMGSDLDAQIDALKLEESKIDSLYDQETSDGRTKSLKERSHEVAMMMEEVTKNVQEVQSKTNEARNKLKETMRKTAEPSWEREKLILWQRFLADPESLQKKYEEAKSIADRLHFASCNQMPSKKNQTN